MRMILAAICALVVGGCGGGNGNADGGNGNTDGGGGNGGSGMPTLKSNIDVSHVVGFALSGSGPAASRAWPEADGGGFTPSMSTLYAIDDQGHLIVTTLTTYSGEGAFDGGTFDLSTTGMSTSVTPKAIYDTPKYVLFSFDSLSIGGGDCRSVILRKSDGALYCGFGGSPSLLPGNAYVDSDGADRLFVNVGPGGMTAGLVRFDMTGGMPQAMSVSDSADNFTVNHDADTLLTIAFSTPRATRIVKGNGGLQNLVADSSSLQWLDSAGHDFFYVSSAVHRAARQGDGSYVDTVIGSFPPGASANRLALVTPTVAYGYALGPTASNALIELNGPTFGMTHPVGALNAITDARGAGSSIFVQGTDAAGNGGIVRVDVPAFTQTTILRPGDFTLSAISVSKTGELTFAGLRNSDGKHVLGNVAVGASTYTILSATAPAVTTLTRIN